MVSPILRRLTGVVAAAGGLLLLAPATARAQDQGSPAHPEITQLTINGVKSVNKDNLEQNLAVQASHCVSLVLKPICIFSKSPLFYKKVYLEPQELARDVLRARVFYFERGFRHTTVDTSVTRVGRDEVHITLDVHEGPPTLVTGVDVAQTKPVLTRRDIDTRLDLQKGQPLDLFRLDTTVVRLSDRLWDRGYSDAIIDTAITVDTAARNAAVAIRIDPRWQSRVASIEVQGTKRISPRTVKKSLSFAPGDLYRRSEVLESQRSLYESNLFRRASIEVPAKDDSLKHVLIVVQEAPPREARYSVGFTTIDFLQVQGRYVDYDWLGGAKRLTLDATVGNLFAQQLNGTGIFYNVGRTVVGGSQSQYLSPTYTTSAELRYPWFGSHENEAAVGVFAHRRSAPGIYVDRGYGASATFTRTITPRGPLSLTYRFEETRVDAGDVYFCVIYGVCDQLTLTALRSNQKLSPLTLSLIVDKTDDPFEPRTGYRTQIALEHASAFTFSDFRYNRAAGGVSMFMPIGKRSVLGGHLQLGYVRALASTAEAVGIGSSQIGDYAILNPTKRFYAGGSQSVRGYGEAQLGPRVLTIPAAKLLAGDSLNPQCRPATITLCNPAVGLLDRDFTPRPLGGNRLIEASVEFRFPLFGNFLGATFVDGAYLAQNTNPGLPASKAAITPGFGVRYLSSVGPIRVDVGLNPSTREALPVITDDIVHGGTSLVTLRDPRVYSPTLGSGGLRSVLQRLTLHLSIGEAF